MDDDSVWDIKPLAGAGLAYGHDVQGIRWEVVTNDDGSFNVYGEHPTLRPGQYAADGTYYPTPDVVGGVEEDE